LLTRLKVNGFKNLDGIDVRFGPFTCIAGPNGVGKSNFFDAIAFLSALADKPLIDAALSVRGGDGRMGDVRSLFRQTGSDMAKEMSFLVEMIIPESGEDVLGQTAKAANTYLQYELVLRYRVDAPGRPLGGLEIVSEDLIHLNRTNARKHLGFNHSKDFFDSVLLGRRTSPYISTETKDGASFISLHADSEGGGRPRKMPASSLPRTSLSSVNNAAEHRTLVLARQEMMAWTQLQLEPSALRAPDSFTAPKNIGANGAHVPATLYHLAQREAQKAPGGDENLYARIANRLAKLAENVASIAVDVDDKRQLLNIVMTDLMGTRHPAGALSDGTLRFLALAVMEVDPSPRALICLEEPENGMHPSRIPAMLALLKDLAVDPHEPVGEDNPLRQVVVNTHSPLVVAEVDDDALLVAQAETERVGKTRNWRLCLSALPDTWRSNTSTIARGVLQDYLNPLQVAPEPRDEQARRVKRVKDRDDLQLLLPLQSTSER
jgi:predicted ATPase